MVDDAGAPIDIAQDKVVLNRWAADVLNANAGDRVRVTYFEPETTHGETSEVHADLVVQGIAEIVTPARPFSRRQPALFHEPPTLANDPDLTPEVPGITDQEAIANWEAPFPIDYDLMQRRDDLYWDKLPHDAQGVLVPGNRPPTLAKPVRRNHFVSTHREAWRDVGVAIEKSRPATRG